MDPFPSNQNRGWHTPHEKRTPLVMPSPKSALSLRPSELIGAQPSDTGPDDHGVNDPLIHGLLARLPKPNAIWSLDDRANWLRTAASIFGLIYKTIDGEHGEISVVFLKQDAGNLPAAEAIAPGFIGR